MSGSDDTKPPRPSPMTWIPTSEASSVLGVTLRTLYRFIDEGVLPAYKFGRKIRLKAADVDDYRRRREAGE